MGLFSRNKKSKNTKKDDENPDWNKDLKRNIINKTGVNQQGLNLQESIDTIGSKDISGIKKGLSINIEKLSSDQVKILKNCAQENTAAELIKILQRTNKTKFKQTILDPLIDCKFFELTIPDKPKSPKQKYRLTGKFVSKRV
ncbi:MAG TPA: hypothetical protein EYO74_00635 [Piscirickettsiaceae bacterium]|nr:hypothetical protein [Piscirickettsiaceae bacterium]